VNFGPLFREHKVSTVGILHNVTADVITKKTLNITVFKIILEMWANAQPDGRPAEYRWRPLFNAAKFG